MAKGRKSKSLRDKLRLEMPEFVEEVDSASVSDLESRLSQLTKGYEATEEAQKNDEELANAKALVRELGAPYRETKNAIKLKTKYIISSIKDKGGDA
jgi:hypothetical protein